MVAMILSCCYCFKRKYTDVLPPYVPFSAAEYEKYRFGVVGQDETIKVEVKTNNAKDGAGREGKKDDAANAAPAAAAATPAPAGARTGACCPRGSRVLWLECVVCRCVGGASSPLPNLVPPLPFVLDFPFVVLGLQVAQEAPRQGRQREHQLAQARACRRPVYHCNVHRWNRNVTWGHSEHKHPAFMCGTARCSTCPGGKLLYQYY